MLPNPQSAGQGRLAVPASFSLETLRGFVSGEGFWAVRLAAPAVDTVIRLTFSHTYV